MNSQLQVEVADLRKFLKELLFRQVAESSQQWLNHKLEQLQSSPLSRNLYLFFGAAPRFVGKDQLILKDADIKRAGELRAGLSLQGWNAVQTARILGLLSYPYEDQKSFSKMLEQLFTTGEVQELVALYSALPLLQYPEALKLRAAEGIRTNMTVVFDAVALDNPYPHDYLDQNAWNQMVLKALFMERPLYRIWGLDHRNNQELSKMISDFAHERWAAGRTTSPEMWRPLGTDIVPQVVEDLRQLLTGQDPMQHAAAILAARQIATPGTLDLLEEFPLITKEVDKQKLNWNLLGEQWWHLKNLSAN